MGPTIFVTTLVLLGMLGIYLRTRKIVYPAHSEYWVYSKIPQLPDTTELMAQMVGSNPYIRRGQNPIGPSEGLIFSDVRFKLALVLRKKNPDFFVDSFTDTYGLPPQTDANAIIKLQYTSTIKLKHLSHLQFLLHLADVVRRMQGTGLVFDSVQKKGYFEDELPSILKSQLDVTQSTFHVTLIENDDHSFETRGLVKIGVKEFTTPPVSFDEVQSIRGVLEELISQVWEKRSYEIKSVDRFGDEYLFDLNHRISKVEIRILRKQEKIA